MTTTEFCVVAIPNFEDGMHELPTLADTRVFMKETCTLTDEQVDRAIKWLASGDTYYTQHYAFVKDQLS